MIKLKLITMKGTILAAILGLALWACDTPEETTGTDANTMTTDTMTNTTTPVDTTMSGSDTTMSRTDTLR